ncbi:MAG: hypothetical protein PHU12_01825 [Candidatus Aenigmarchaeota archaeon]|nr:hypothetical protein [Candidatus Aenigmarchaeota archaeon]
MKTPYSISQAQDAMILALIEGGHTYSSSNRPSIGDREALEYHIKEMRRDIAEEEMVEAGKLSKKTLYQRRYRRRKAEESGIKKTQAMVNKMNISFNKMFEKNLKEDAPWVHNEKT